jgi:biopolymer transport protein ExbD
MAEVTLYSKLLDKLNDLYHPQLSIVEIILPFLIIFIVMCITVTYMIQIELSTSSLNWEKNKCLPKYMFVSGFIQKEDKLGVLASTQKNFKNCVQQFVTKIPYVDTNINRKRRGKK